MAQKQPPLVAMYGVAVGAGLTTAAIVAVVTDVGLAIVIPAAVAAFAVAAAILAARAAHRLTQRVSDLEQRLDEATQNVDVLLDLVPYEDVEALARRQGFDVSVEPKGFHLRGSGGTTINHTATRELSQDVVARLMLRALAREAPITRPKR